MPTSLYDAFCNEIDTRYSILSNEARSDLKRMLKRVEEDAFERGYYPKKRKEVLSINEDGYKGEDRSLVR